MNALTRLMARVTNRSTDPKVKHYRGLPPELTGGKDLRELLEAPVLLVIEKEVDGVFLFRFTAAGQVVGDTWHRTVEEAQQQARFEFGESLSNWISVPADVEDVVSFGLKGVAKGPTEAE